MSLFPSDSPETSGAFWRSIESLSEQWPFLPKLITYALFLAVGWFPALMLQDKLRELWPSIELQIGPEHTLIEKRRRVWLSGAFVVGVLPLIISIIS